MPLPSLTSRPLRVACLAALALLAGCEAAEDATRKLAEEARREVEQVAREAIKETARELNQQIDQAQKSTEEWLDGKPAEQQDETEAPREQDPPRQHSA
ncbi:hypothetical protein D9M68_348640 [compost metagenome]